MDPKLQAVPCYIKSWGQWMGFKIKGRGGSILQSVVPPCWLYNRFLRLCQGEETLHTQRPLEGGRKGSSC